MVFGSPCNKAMANFSISRPSKVKRSAKEEPEVEVLGSHVKPLELCRPPVEILVPINGGKFFLMVFGVDRFIHLL